MSEYEDHHFVPQCYLNNFRSSENGPLFVLNIENVKRGYKTKVKPFYPKAICYQENFYSIKRGLILSREKRPANYIENEVNGYYENNLPSLISKIIKSPIISLEEATLFSDLIIHLKVRNPYQLLLNEKNKFKRVNDVAANNYVRLREEYLNKGYPEEIFDLLFNETVSNLFNNINLVEDFQIESLIQKFENPDYRNRIFRNAILSSSWTLLEINEKDIFFITTDNPGVAIDNERMIHNTKFTNGYQYYFPLSPNYVLMLSDLPKKKNDSEKILIDRVKVESYTIQKINELFSQVSNKLLISNSSETLNFFLRT